MRIPCPDCAAEYDVPDAALGTQRRLRCSACGTSWEWSPPAATPQTKIAEAPPPPARESLSIEAVPAPEAAPPGPEATPRIEMAPEQRMAFPAPLPPPPEPRRPAMLAWAASLAIIVLALAALYVWRAPIMHAWPPAARLYAALGLT